jgi:hypothetical protein
VVIYLPNFNFKASSNKALNEAIDEALSKNQKKLLEIF